MRDIASGQAVPAMTSDAQPPETPWTSWTLGAIKQDSLMLDGQWKGPGCKRFYTFSQEELIALAGSDYVLEGLNFTLRRHFGRGVPAFNGTDFGKQQWKLVANSDVGQVR